MTILKLSSYDYVLCIITVIISISIGLFFGCYKNRKSTTNEYLVGNRKMKVFPASLSLIAGHITAGAFIVIASEVYLFGAAYLLSVVPSVITTIITIHIFLPVLFNMKAISMYEYLEKRFDSRTRKLGSFFFALNVFVALPPSTYITALTLVAATGFSLNSMIWTTCGICTFYTTIGGFKTVIWTDVFQFFILTVSMLTVFVVGLVSVGGVQEVWSKSLEGGRLDISFDPDPTVRDSFWAVVIGFTVTSISMAGVNQANLQKLLAMPKLEDAIKSLKHFTVGLIVSRVLFILLGLIVYAKYSGCDPFQSKQIQRRDQLVMYFLNDISQDIPGLTGIFVAGILCACLSTLSAYLNCAAGCVYKDFLESFLENKVSQNTAKTILMALVVVFGIMNGFMSLVISYFENMFMFVLSAMSFTFVPKLAMFTLGVLFPKANAKGAFYGSIIGLLLTTCIIVPGKYYQLTGAFKRPFKEISIDNCTMDVFKNNSLATLVLNETTKNSLPTNTSLQFQPPFIFRISFYYDPLIGAVCCIIIGIIISYLTNTNDSPVDKTLIRSIRPILFSKKTNNRKEEDCEGTDIALVPLTKKSSCEETDVRI